VKQWLLIGIFVLAVGSVAAISAQENPTAQCQSVGGTFMIDFIDETTAVAALTGDLNGAVRGVILENAANENGTLELTLEHAITTEAGDLLLPSDQATLTPVMESMFFMHQDQTIVGGSGKFANATGSLEEFGAVDMAAGLGVLRYSGEICQNS
jgi:hypothetical protein